MTNNTNPEYYKKGNLETWDILSAKLSKEELKGFCKGNILKYIIREGLKTEGDLEKAKWYLEKLILL